MSGFQKHGIKHSSASSINKWVGDPCAWLGQYLFGIRTPPKAVFARGHAVEYAVVATISGALSHERAMSTAMERFDASYKLNAEDLDKERPNIAPMIEQALEVLRPLGEPDMPAKWPDQQHKVSLTARTDEWTLPVIGFLDLLYPTKGLVIDLKSTLRMPSKETMIPAHQRQRAIYAGATNYDVKFLYVSPKKHLLLGDGEPSELMRQIKAHLIRQERFLALGDADLLRQIVPITETFYWDGLEDQRVKTFGL